MLVSFPSVLMSLTLECKLRMNKMKYENNYIWTRSAQYGRYASWYFYRDL